MPETRTPAASPTPGNPDNPHHHGMPHPEHAQPKRLKIHEYLTHLKQGVPALGALCNVSESLDYSVGDNTLYLTQYFPPKNKLPTVVALGLWLNTLVKAVTSVTERLIVPTTFWEVVTKAVEGRNTTIINLIIQQLLRTNTRFYQAPPWLQHRRLIWGLHPRFDIEYLGEQYSDTPEREITIRYLLARAYRSIASPPTGTRIIPFLQDIWLAPFTARLTLSLAYRDVETMTIVLREMGTERRLGQAYNILLPKPPQDPTGSQPAPRDRGISPVPIPWPPHIAGTPPSPFPIPVAHDGDFILPLHGSPQNGPFVNLGPINNPKEVQESIEAYAEFFRRLPRHILQNYFPPLPGDEPIGGKVADLVNAILLYTVGLQP